MPGTKASRVPDHAQVIKSHNALHPTRWGDKVASRHVVQIRSSLGELAWGGSARPNQFAVNRLKHARGLPVIQVGDLPGQFEVIQRFAQQSQAVEKTSDMARGASLAGVEPVGIDGHAHSLRLVPKPRSQNLYRKLLSKSAISPEFALKFGIKFSGNLSIGIGVSPQHAVLPLQSCARPQLTPRSRGENTRPG